jgi:hypothetical protein
MKKQLIIVGIMLVLLAVGLSGCTQEDKLKDLSYKNTQYGFGLNSPAGWTTDENDQYGVVRFYGPTENNFAVNLGVTEPSTMNESETLSSGIEQVLAYLPTILTNFSLISNNAITVNGMNAQEITYTFAQGIYSLQGKQVYIEKSKIVYCLTYTALLDTYNTYLSVIDQSINSFTII